jgi:hypothetical protein
MQLVIRQAGEPRFVQIAHGYELPKDKQKLRIAIVEHAINLPALPPQIVFHVPHFAGCRSCGRPSLELSHDAGQSRIEGGVESAPRDLLLGTGPSNILRAQERLPGHTVCAQPLPTR